PPTVRGAPRAGRAGSRGGARSAAAPPWRRGPVPAPTSCRGSRLGSGAAHRGSLRSRHPGPPGSRPSGNQSPEDEEGDAPPDPRHHREDPGVEAGGAGIAVEGEEGQGQVLERRGGDGGAPPRGGAG